MRWKLIVIGTSWGGFAALKTLLSGLPADFSVPIAIVQHRWRDNDSLLVTLLQEHTGLRVVDADDKMPLEAGVAFLAPPDYHMLIDDGMISLSLDEPVGYSRPSIDVLFESAAEVYRRGAIGVVLTGANRDGTVGLRRIKELGGVAIVQDPASAESPIMPTSAIGGATVDYVLPLTQIATFLVSICSGAGGPRGAGLWCG